MKYQCIIFDCDGVLVDSEGISTRVLLDMANVLGAAIDVDFFERNFAGKSLKSMLEVIDSRIDQPLPSDFEARYRQQTYEAFRREMKPIEGVHQLLDTIKVPYGVASSGPPEKIRLNLTTVGLIDKFEGRIFSSYDIGSWKPDPDIFEYAAREMGFSPQECAVVEDSIAGVMAAMKGGFDVYGFATTKNQRELEKEGATVFFHMDELGDLIR